MPTQIYAKRLIATSGLCALIGWAASAGAQSLGFMDARQTAGDGGLVEQIANTMVFPNFRGDARSVSSLSVERLGQANAVRSIKVLVERDDSSANLFTLRAENASIAARVSPSAIAVTFGDSNPLSLSQSTESKLLWRPIPKDVKYLMFTAYLVPKTTAQSEWSDSVIVTANEAVIQGASIVAGREIADPIRSALSPYGLDAFARSGIDVSSSQRDNRTLAFVEQRTVPLADSPNSHHRSKRCFEDFIQGVTSLSAWWWERLFGAPSICSTRTSDPMPDTQIDLVTTQPLPVNVDLSVYEANEIGGGNVPDFDVAMGVLFCGDRPNMRRESGPDACTMQDREAIAAVGELPPTTIRSLLQQINAYNVDSASGAAAPLRLTTGNARLDGWLLADTERAANALSTAENVVQVSDSRAKPNEPSNLRQRKKKVVKASCADNNATREATEQGWECVKKAKRKIKRQDDAIALPPQLQTGGRYYLASRTADGREFSALVSSLRQQRTEMPAGMRPDEFASQTAAIAHDGAATGDNLGIVYLNDPRGVRGQRFGYGLEHIWAPGGGGGDDGHRNDWRALSVDSRDMLTRVIMAALTDVDAQYTQTRTADGKVVRTYSHFTFRDGARVAVFRNVRIVLRQNGMVVTAFPLKKAKREEVQLFM
ncbi:hypothetical protein [Burkholderia singularis]|uniref:Uncharacterized protein n=1 Tax=Burkholderia singularis TaxID=1503053 RepID=A0A238H4G0_9BURK|nr:hypothetical protein [Burkholderia singularis]SMG00241.1 hypothetical protein BSIN_3309 [Burkholderia singularis]